MKRFPWYGTVLLAIIVYSAIKYGLPQMIEVEESLEEFITLFAPLSAMGLLLLAAKQLYDDENPKENEEDELDDSSPEK